MRERLRGALTRALKERDAVAVSALRSALAAIDDAEAVDAPPGGVTAGGPTAGDVVAGLHPTVAGAVDGVRAADVPRRDLTEAQIRALVANEVAERRAAAAEYERLARPQRAERLHAEADLLAAVLGE